MFFSTPIDWAKKHPQRWIGALIFLACCFIYLANNDTISSSDNFPNSLLGFNWLFNQTLHFDAFRQGYAYRLSSTTPYFFVEAPNGHLTSTYPIGTAIITFPLYCLFFLYLKLTAFAHALAGNSADLLDITTRDFSVYRRTFEKLAAAIAASFSVVIFYLCVRLKFSTAVALSAAFVFAFATNTWMTSSQGLWQHGISNLILLSSILCLLKANRSSADSRKRLLLVVGILCGLLPGVRPTSLLFAIALITYAVFTHRREAVFLLLGLPTALLSAGWNFYYFGFDFRNFFVGGYSRFSETAFVDSYYQFTPQQFVEGFLGVLVSPSRGWLIYSPVMLFALLGAWRFARRPWGRDEWLLASVIAASIALFAQYCCFTIWTGGWCYGPRYMTDLVPTACLLIAYFLDHQFQPPQRRTAAMNAALGLFLCGLLFSVFTQVVGAFGATEWDGVPFAADERVWQWQDSQIERSTRALLVKLAPPIDRPARYLKHFAGTIEQIQTADRQPQTLLSARPQEQKTLLAALVNTGKSPWFGYQTGISRGLALINVQFFDRSGVPVPIAPKNALKNALYVSGQPQPSEAAEAIGSITFPAKPGDYRMRFQLAVQGMKPPRSVTQTLELPAQVRQ